MSVLDFVAAQNELAKTEQKVAVYGFYHGNSLIQGQFADPIEIVLDIETDASTETRAQLLRCKQTRVSYSIVGCRITLVGYANDCEITNGLGTLHRNGTCLVVTGFANPKDFGGTLLNAPPSPVERRGELPALCHPPRFPLP